MYPVLHRQLLLVPDNKAPLAFQPVHQLARQLFAGQLVQDVAPALDHWLVPQLAHC